MSVVRLKERTSATVLVARSAASEVSGAIEKALAEDAGGIDFDFDGIRVVAPSFLDQLLIVTEQIESALGLRGHVRITFRNCPHGMQEKLAAIGRAHDAEVVATDDHTWIMRRSA